MKGNPTTDSKSVIATLGSDTPDYEVIFAGLKNVKVRDDVLQHYFQNGTSSMGAELLMKVLDHKANALEAGEEATLDDTDQCVGVMGTIMGLLLIDDELEACADVSDTILEYDPNYSFARLVQKALEVLGDDASLVFRKSLADLAEDTTEPV